ncbi:MAG: OmpH family outer membrane protein [Bacteroidales bacterium]
MKKLVLITILSVFVSQVVFSQRFAYVDSEYILNKLPSYQAALTKLEGFSKTWQKEVEEKFTEVEKKYKEFQNEKVLLTEDMRKQKEDEIIQLEKEAKDLKKKYFGVDGEMFKKREELVKPIQEEVYNAIKQLATEGNYAMIFDIAAGATLLYTDEKYDVSDDVLKKINF